MIKESKRIVDVLKFLASGPARFEVILKNNFTDTETGKRTSRQYFERFMSVLAREEYILVSRYRDRRISNKHFKVAILRERGIEYLCEMRPDFDPEDTRSQSPQKNQIYHELLLSLIVRQIREETNKEEGFKINKLLDDAAMKSLTRLDGGKISKYSYFPDLLLNITAKGVKIGFLIELDCGSRCRSYWTRKIKSFGGETSIIISLSKTRMMQLYNYVHYMKMDGKMFFCDLDDFKKSGLLFFIDKCLDSSLKKGIYLLNRPQKEDVI